jgi:tetratricopeptide (TPR) repeat protein
MKRIDREQLNEAVAEWQQMVATSTQYNLRLGHAFLLVEDFDKALQYYLRFRQFCPEAALGSIPFLYGLGLVYYHFDHREDALKCFNDILNLEPQFLRGNEVMLRLGILYLKKGNYDAALDFFNKVYADTRPCTLSPPEVLLYIGYTKVVMYKLCEALKVFGDVIDSCEAQAKVKSIAYRQQALIYQKNPSIEGVSPNGYVKAVEMLNASLSIYPSCCVTWFNLGKCYHEQGKTEEAFKAYKFSVKYDSSVAEVWCQIGILYHQRGQGKDALSSYVSAAHLKPSHLETWYNMAILYQSMGQDIDGLLCYENAVKNSSGTNVYHNELSMRMEVIRTRVHSAYHELSEKQPELIPLKDAWTSCVHPRVKQLVFKPYEPILTVNVDQDSSFKPLPNREKKSSKMQDPVLVQGGVGSRNGCPSQSKPDSCQSMFPLGPVHRGAAAVTQHHRPNRLIPPMPQMPVSAPHSTPPLVGYQSHPSTHFPPAVTTPYTPSSHQTPCHPQLLPSAHPVQTSCPYPPHQPCGVAHTSWRGSEPTPPMTHSSWRSEAEPTNTSTSCRGNEVPPLVNHTSWRGSEPTPPMTHSSWRSEAEPTNTSTSCRGNEVPPLVNRTPWRGSEDMQTDLSSQLLGPDSDLTVTRDAFDWIVSPRNIRVNTPPSQSRKSRNIDEELLNQRRPATSCHQQPVGLLAYSCSHPISQQGVFSATSLMDTVMDQLEGDEILNLIGSPSFERDLPTTPASHTSSHSLSP